MAKKLALVALVAAAALTAAVAVQAGNGTAIDTDSANVLTLAVYGDAPYGTTPTDTSEFEATPAFVDSINSDPKVDLVAHVGDIHSGKQFCTQTYDQSIYNLWTQYKDPLVYTPGDNEWSDCHKSGEGGGLGVDYANGDPAANLSLVRSIFFSSPGTTLGGRKKQVVSQAQVGQGTDAKYVENVLWEQSKTVFVTIDIPGGSNNDTDPWFGANETAAQVAAQAAEVSERTAADLHWIDAAFAQAEADHATAVVIFEQADMWDLDGKDPSHIANYKPFIDSIAAHTTAFGKPVLLFNGDSHIYRSDNPLAPNAPCVIEPTSGAAAVACSSDASANQAGPYNVPNFHRVVVHGSTFPLEWLELTIDPRASNPTTATSFGPFAWIRIQP
jgi:hypothetical protein